MNKETIGYELMRLIQKNDISKICQWAFRFYTENLSELDSKDKELLQSLFSMEDDPQFEFTFPELKKLASELILGNEDALEQINAPKRLELFLYDLILDINQKTKNEVLQKTDNFEVYAKAIYDMLSIIKKNGEVYYVDKEIIDMISKKLDDLKEYKGS